MALSVNLILEKNNIKNPKQNRGALMMVLCPYMFGPHLWEMEQYLPPEKMAKSIESSSGPASKVYQRLGPRL